MPSMMVVDLPNFLVSSRMRIRCCSFSISPQTHRSFGCPHVEQTSAMTLNSELATAVYKSFKGLVPKFWVSIRSGGNRLLSGDPPPPIKGLLVVLSLYVSVSV